MTSTTADIAERPLGTLPPPVAATRIATATGRPARRVDALRPYVRPVVAVLVTVVAYRVSLSTLLESLSLDTPLAHLAIVPFIGLVLIVVGARSNGGPPIHDRQLDWIVGIPLVVAALFANLVLPAHLSTEFWVYRIDLLSLPFFVAGIIALLFGVRMLWRARIGVLFLYLAWPYPYNRLLDRWLEPFTAVTVHAVTAAVAHIQVAAPSPGGAANALFTVKHAGKAFDLSVATECSGANGLLGFSIVAFAFLCVARGSRWAKLAWLATGAALVWALNVVRILIIFGAGRQWGQKVAVDGFHPVIGLIVFNVGILAMAVLLPRFRLEWGIPRRPAVALVGGGAPGGTRPMGAGPRIVPAAPRPRAHRPAVRAAGLVVALSALGVAVLNADLRNSDLVASSLGTPRLASFEQTREEPDGWQVTYRNQFDWTRRFFGPDSVWRRYIYVENDPSAPTVSRSGGPEIRSNAGLFADVITTSDRSAFSNYGIEACYRFHNFRTTARQPVDLGNGVVGGLLTWRDPSAETTTTTLYWHWPIKQGNKTRWERVTLLLTDSPGLTFKLPKPPSESLTKEFRGQVTKVLKSGQADDLTTARLVETRQFLVAFAERMIELRGAASTSTRA